MTFQFSQRGKEYLKTAQTILRAAQAMTDRAIAGQLEAFAEDSQRRAEKAFHVEAGSEHAAIAKSRQTSPSGGTNSGI
jgi:hypothetical protein